MPAISWNGAGLWVWFACFAVSLVCLVVGAASLLLARRATSWWGRQARTALLLSAVAIFAVDSVIWAERLTGPVAHFCLQIGLVVLGFRCYAWLGHMSYRAPRLASLVLVACSLLLGGWLIWRLESDSERDDHNASALTAMEDVYLETAAASDSARAWTDAGRPIPLQITHAKVGTLADVLAKAVALQGQLPHENRVLVTGPMDATHNCYGWVFTGGRFYVRRDDIERILADNQYVQVESPAAGDLILYRDYEGFIIHSGIVKAVGVDNYVLIESKWGLIGNRVLHPPEAQAYSQRYAYYRSPRQGHLLHGLEHAELTQR